jgi:hypothetical protein
MSCPDKFAEDTCDIISWMLTSRCTLEERSVARARESVFEQQIY